MGVQIHGLELRPELNGAMGLLTKFDTQTKRWGVDLEDGSGAKSLKENNLMAVSDDDVFVRSAKLPRPRRRTLCRYGQKCWRPECHFVHTNEHSRAAHWRQHWQSLCSSADASESNSTGLPPTGEAIQDLVAQLKVQDDKIKTSCQDIADVKLSLNNLDQATNVSGLAAIEEKVALVGGDLTGLTDLAALKWAELEDSMSSDVMALHHTVDAIAKESKQSQLDFERRFDKQLSSLSIKLNKLIDEKEERQKHMLDALSPMMQAAFTPLAEHVTWKIMEFEKKLSHIT